MIYLYLASMIILVVGSHGKNIVGTHGNDTVGTHNDTIGTHGNDTVRTHGNDTVRTHGNDNETGQISFFAESKFSHQGSFKSLTLRCSLPVPAKDMAKIKVITISNESKPGGDTRGKDVAEISSRDGLLVRDPDLKADISGDISNGTTGYFSMVWSNPGDTVSGTYVCRIVLLENSQGTPENSIGSPENSSGTPENSSGTSENSNRTPENNNGTPGNSNETPGNSNGILENSNGTPENNYETPENTNGTTKNSKRATENSNGTPENSNGVTENNNEATENSNGAPENNSGTAKNNKGTTRVLTSKVKIDYQSLVMNNLVSRLNTMEDDVASDLDKLTGRLDSVEGNTTNAMTSLEKEIKSLKGSQTNTVKKSSFWISDVWKGSRYYLSHFNRYNGPDHAQLICQGLGGYLMEPDSLEEFDHVLEFIKTYPVKKALESMRVAIGGTDEASEGTWKGKRTGKTMNKYIRWIPNNPDDWYNEDCLEYIVYKDAANDFHCWESPDRFLCEVPESQNEL